ncbi:RHS repeat domain-containing protein, partial [Planctomycetota bacterium]
MSLFKKPEPVVDAAYRLTGEELIGNMPGSAGTNETTAEEPGNESGFSEEISGVGVVLPLEVHSLAQTWEYDDSGNRLEQELINADPLSTNSGITGYTYDNDNLLQVSVFDNNTDIDPSDDTTITYSYDDEGKLIGKVIDDLSQVPATEVTETFDYNYMDRMSYYLREKTGLPDPEAQWTYGFDPTGRRLFKNDDERVPQLAEWYMYNGDDIISDYDLDATSYTLKAGYINGTGIDQKIAKVDYPSESKNYYVHDGLGSVHMMISDATELMQNMYITDAWGNDVARDEGVDNRYDYTGRENDAESSLKYYRARMYDPTIGRFTQKDPSGSPDGPNRYIYCDNNPVNAVDPSGLWSVRLHKEMVKDVWGKVMGKDSSSPGTWKKEMLEGICAGVEWADIPVSLGRMGPNRFEQRVLFNLIRVYREHYGDLAFNHSMHYNENTAMEVRDKMINRVKAKVFTYWEKGKKPDFFEMGFALGEGIHTVQDSFCKSHAARDGLFDITLFQNYAMQDPKKHAVADEDTGG